jgi:hypothetical protein
MERKNARMAGRSAFESRALRVEVRSAIGA